MKSKVVEDADVAYVVVCDPTLEAIVTETSAELRKVMRPDLGIALIDLDQSEA